MERQFKMPAVFRKDREGIIFAMFPEDPADNLGRFCTCYQHVGQHSGADYYGCVQTSALAKPEEYNRLLRELQCIGYDNLKIIKRASPDMHQKRRELARR